MAVYWITGFSGAGKSTIGYEYYLHLISSGANVVFLDGDELRLVMGGEHGFAPHERPLLSCVMTYSRLPECLPLSHALKYALCFI